MRALSWVVRLIVVACLGVQSYVHLSLAPTYDVVKASVSQGLLFRIEGIAAAVIAVLVLLTGASVTFMLAFFAAAIGAAAVLVYRYVDLGSYAGWPGMTEMTWFPQGSGDYRKIGSVIAELVGMLVALVGIGVGNAPRLLAPKQEPAGVG